MTSFLLAPIGQVCAHSSDEYWNLFVSQGVEYMKQQQDEHLPLQEHYIRYIGKHVLPDSEEPLKFIICMFPESSHRLASAKYLQSDIAFKRVVNFYEFELGSWDELNNISKCLFHIS
jgi:hypothetical protein